MSLAFNERGYTLRNVAADNLPTGFFAGPPADCAIQRLLGVPFAARELVSLVLGGAPVLAPPYEVVAQSWDPRHGHEVLRLRAPGYEQELRFAFVDGVWWPAGGTLWQRRSNGELARMWSLLHEDLHPVDGTVLPRRTRLAGPSTRRQDLVIITYGAQTVDPALGDSSAAASDDDAGWEDEDTASPRRTARAARATRARHLSLGTPRRDPARARRGDHSTAVHARWRRPGPARRTLSLKRRRQRHGPRTCLRGHARRVPARRGGHCSAPHARRHRPRPARRTLPLNPSTHEIANSEGSTLPSHSA
ncbi:hypothetical protein [Nannocystis pusilla]|uniref:hypothetical protein n=1 Tax=Nannocystis pusilla TaxID=889268 RepID=UPI003B80799D